MRCPYCGGNGGNVIDSRPIEESSLIRRRRECSHCKKRFTTYERVEVSPLMVIKNDQRRETFDRDKLRKGVELACLKRPISVDAIEKILSEIEQELSDYIIEVPSKTIGDMVLKRLRKLDEVSYIRFASIYKQFDCIDTFLKELRRMKGKH